MTITLAPIKYPIEFDKEEKEIIRNCTNILDMILEHMEFKHCNYIIGPGGYFEHDNLAELYDVLDSLVDCDMLCDKYYIDSLKES